MIRARVNAAIHVAVGAAEVERRSGARVFWFFFAKKNVLFLNVSGSSRAKRTTHLDHVREWFFAPRPVFGARDFA